METINRGGWHPHMPENPNDKMAVKYAIWTVVAFVAVIFWAMVTTPVLLQTLAGFFCLAIVFGKIQITELPNYDKLFNKDAEYNA